MLTYLRFHKNTLQVDNNNNNAEWKYLIINFFQLSQIKRLTKIILSLLEYCIIVVYIKLLINLTLYICVNNKKNNTGRIDKKQFLLKIVFKISDLFSIV